MTARSTPVVVWVRHEREHLTDLGLGVGKRQDCTEAACACELPSELDSDESFARFHHVDIARLSHTALVIEEQRARAALAHTPDEQAQAWWLERLRRVQAERRRRA